MVGPAAPPGRVLVGASARREGLGSVHSASRPGDRSRRGLCALGRRFGRTGGPAGKGFGGSAGPSRRGWFRASCFAVRRPLLPGVCALGRRFGRTGGPAGKGFGGSAGPSRRGWFRASCLAARRPLPPGVRLREGLVILGNAGIHSALEKAGLSIGCTGSGGLVILSST